MKHPMELLGSLYSNSPTSDELESSESLRHERRAARVWERLRETYGDRFSREFGSVPNETWAATIARLSDADIAASLRSLAEKGSPHPPSLGEFVKAGQPETGSPRYLGANPIHMTELRRTGQLPREEKQVRDINELRKALR